MEITEKSCSALKKNRESGHSCKNGHATTGACYGNGYPNGVPIPVCVREDKIFDEHKKNITIVNWLGA
jgi:hypothetical protein